MYTVIHKEELEYFPSNSSLETDLKSEFRKIGQKQAKAAGIDNIAGTFLKEGASVLSTPLTQICNLSI